MTARSDMYGRRSARIPAIVAALAFVVPSTALAAGAGRRPSRAASRVDLRADHSAQLAYRAYLAGLVADAPAWSRAADAYVASISSGCPNVLAAINLLPLSSLNQAAMEAFGEEAGADLGVVTNASDVPRLERLAKALTRLRWTRRASRSIVRELISAQRTMLALPPSPLCADAGALAASNGQTMPPGTLPWLATFGRDDTRAGHAVSAFTRLLARFAGAVAGPVIDSINHLADRLSANWHGVLQTEGPKLLSAVGLTS